MSSEELEYLPVEIVADYEGINVESLKSLRFNKTFGNDKRFKMINGKLHVLSNYKYPLADTLNDLREKALIIAKSENNLCKELSKISDLKQNTIQQYFYRFTFKQMEKAETLISLLKTYIKNNSLFTSEELTYE